MPKKHQLYPPMYIGAIVLSAAGIAIAIGAVLVQPERHLYKGLIFLAVAFLNFGGGEILNHPRESVGNIREQTEQKENITRKRNTCGLGNLLDIVGLLMFFVALASFIYER